MEPVHHKTQEPIHDEERDLIDPETWNWELTEAGKTTGTAGAIIEVRFARDEILALSHLAKQIGVGSVEYTRQTMVQHIADHNEHGELQHKRMA